MQVLVIYMVGVGPAWAGEGVSPLLSLMSTVAWASSSRAMSSRLPPKAAWCRAEKLAWGIHDQTMATLAALPPQSWSSTPKPVLGGWQARVTSPLVAGAPPWEQQQPGRQHERAQCLG